MKKKSFALAMVFALMLALTGCSAGREGHTLGPVGSDSGAYETDDGNDAFEGGGAGGTNDRDNDGRPDSSADPDDHSGVGKAADEIGRAAGDLARGAGDMARDAGDAIGDVVDDIDRDMR